MMKVHVEPLGIDVEVGDEETLMQAANRMGYYWPTICGGHAECGACHCLVTSGQDGLEAPSKRELGVLAMKNRNTEDNSVRLACCLRGNGPVTVTKNGVRKR